MVNSLVEAVQQLKIKQDQVKQVLGMQEAKDTMMGRAARLKTFQDQLETVSFKTREAYLTNCNPVLIQTSKENKDKLLLRLNTLGIFVVDGFAIAERVAARIAPAVTLQRGVKADHLGLVVEELRAALTHIGIHGNEVPKFQNLDNQKSLQNHNELVEEIYKILQKSYAKAAKNMESQFFLYSSQHLVNYLSQQEVIAAKNKIMVVLVPEAGLAWMQFLQKVTGKAVTKMLNSDVKIVSDRIKSLFKSDGRQE